MFRNGRQELRFEWSHLGDIALGRPNLGATTSVAAYRLMQFTLRDAMVKHFGAEQANQVFYDAGYEAGEALYENLLGAPKDLDTLVTRLQQVMKEQSIGILRLEKADLDQMEFVMTVAEDLDCSGLPLMDEAVCTYDEGLIAGIMTACIGRPFVAKEVDCWCTGDRVCRFEAHVDAA